MSSSKGWIAIPREMTDSWLWRLPLQWKLWQGIVMRAAYKPGNVTIAGCDYMANRGELAYTTRTLPKELGCSRQTLISFIKVLQEKKMIAKRVMYGNKFSVMTIVDYDKYQPFVSDITAAIQSNSIIASGCKTISIPSTAQPSEEKRLTARFGENAEGSESQTIEIQLAQLEQRLACLISRLEKTPGKPEFMTNSNQTSAERIEALHRQLSKLEKLQSIEDTRHAAEAPEAYGKNLSAEETMELKKLNFQFYQQISVSEEYWRNMSNAFEKPINELRKLADKSVAEFTIKKMYKKTREEVESLLFNWIRVKIERNAARESRMAQPRNVTPRKIEIDEKKRNSFTGAYD